MQIALPVTVRTHNDHFIFDTYSAILCMVWIVPFACIWAELVLAVFTILSISALLVKLYTYI